MNKMQKQVLEFMQTAGYLAPKGPMKRFDGKMLLTLPNGQKTTRGAYFLSRVGWMTEEVLEFDEALKAQDIVGMLDAIADLLYFAFGTAVSLGIDIEPFFDEVQQANMTKFLTCRNCGGQGNFDVLGEKCAICNGHGKVARYRQSDGKLTKPDGWQPPNLKAIFDEL